MTPDSELLSQYAHSRANDAFAEFVARYAPVVYRCALRQLQGNTHAAQEVTQNVFTLVARKAAKLASHESVVGWLHTTTRHTTRDFLRAAGRRQRHEQAAALFEHETAAAPVSWERIQPIIDQVLEQLSDVDREAVVLRYFAELPFGAIGNRLGIGENAARMRVDRALEKLRRHLQARGIESTSVALALALSGEAAAAPAGLAAQVAASAVSSATGAVTVGGFIGLAVAGKFVAGLCSAVIVGSVVVLGYGWHAEVAARQDAAAAEADAALAEVRAQRLVASATAEESNLARLRAMKSEARSRSSRSPGGGSEPKAPDNWDPKREGDALLARHPEVRDAMAAWQRSTMLFQMGDLTRELRLTPEQIQRLVDLQSHGMTLMGDFAAGGKSVVLGLDPGQGGISGDELFRILGPDGSKRWNAVQLQNSARVATAELASSLAFSEAPLTSEQSTALMTTLATHTHMTESGATIDWESVTDTAKEILTPAQVIAFDQVREQALAERKMQLHASPPKSGPDSAARAPTP